MIEEFINKENLGNILKTFIKNKIDFIILNLNINKIKFNIIYK
jgi:hypothetical protein